MIGLNLAAFLAMAVAGGTGSSVYRRFASGGGEVTWDYGLLGIGREGFRLVGVAEGDWWRLVTGGFLHAGLLHHHEVPIQLQLPVQYYGYLLHKGNP